MADVGTGWHSVVGGVGAKAVLQVSTMVCVWVLCTTMQVVGRGAGNSAVQAWECVCVTSRCSVSGGRLEKVIQPSERERLCVWFFLFALYLVLLRLAACEGAELLGIWGVFHCSTLLRLTLYIVRCRVCDVVRVLFRRTVRC